MPDKSASNNRYDLFSSSFKADPFPTYAQMRTESPIYAHIAPDGQTIWYITRYDDVIAVLKDDENFVKNSANIAPEIGIESGQSATPARQAINQNMLFSDPPHHTRLRTLINQAFTSRRIDQMAPNIQIIADTLLDQATKQTEMDIIADYALPLPVIVICDMLGIPSEDRDLVSGWSQAIISPGRHNLGYGARRRTMKAFLGYLRQIFTQRRQQPKDDLITALIQAEPTTGDKLSEEELSSMVALLLVTGHETTVNLIGNGVLALLQNPSERQKLQNDPASIEATVEELLRFDGPVETSTTRWAKQDMMFKGHSIERGDIIRVVLSSANRDEAKFDK
ncbi:MAG: cytochrome P450, partial [Chloroflexota bacterium]